MENRIVGMGSMQVPQGRGLLLSTGAAPTRALWFWSPCEPGTKLTWNLSHRRSQRAEDMTRTCHVMLHAMNAMFHWFLPSYLGILPYGLTLRVI